MKCLVVYSSVTGNTRSVAEAIHQIMPPGTVLSPVQNAPEPGEFDFLALGFWVHRAMPDPRMFRYMERVRGKNVAWFGTLAAWPDSPHAKQVRDNAQSLLRANQIQGGFLCQGRLEAKRFAAAMKPGHGNPTHPMTDERRARLVEANKHPDETDFAAARQAFTAFLGQCENSSPHLVLLKMEQL